MIIRKDKAKDRLNIIDGVTADVSDGARLLYLVLASKQSGVFITDPGLVDLFNVSQRVVGNRKKELRDAGLLLEDKVTPRIRAWYVGHPGMTAQKVKEQWEKSGGYMDE